MSITIPAGFTAAGIAAGIKGEGLKDLALIHNHGPSKAAAAVFTRNRVAAAPVIWSREAISDGELAAVVMNSGGANACTGQQGYADAQAMAETTAAGLNLAATQVAVCSTGLIGVRLPMDAVLTGITSAHQQLSRGGGSDAAHAIMTTDTVPKQAAHIDEGWSIGGMAKGAGMLAPSLATMLVVLTTDADLSSSQLDEALREATRVSFDRLDGDGCMSTNDTVLLLASGASGVRPQLGEFRSALAAVCQDLARSLIADAEGAHHEIAIEVVGAASVSDAETVGHAVARSNLFKCAIFGADPNWGRVLASIGVTDAVFEPDRLDVSFNGIQVCRAGGIGEPRELVDLSGREVHVLIDLHAGVETATILTTDLTYDYVKENAEYSS